MKHTLREEIEILINVLMIQQKGLNNQIEKCVRGGNLGDAAINQIKHDTITPIIEMLKDILKG